MIEKTKAYIIRGRNQGARRHPCFINGTLPRPNSVSKVMVYYFNDAAELVITLVPSINIHLAEFRLT